MTKNPKKPFKIICMNCGVEVTKEDKSEDFSFDSDTIEVVGQSFYDSAITFIECECGNEIKL